MRTRTCIILLAALLHAATFTACQDDTQEIILPPAPDNTVPVEVELAYEDEEDGYGMDNSRTPRSASTTEKNQNTGLDAELIPEVKSRSTEVKPDKLYGLHIRQLYSNGTSLVSNANYSETAELGTKLTPGLVPNTECQIVIIARGANTNPAIDSNSNWATLQGYKSGADIKSIDGTNQASLRNMPYILHLEKVKVVQKDGKYVIQNVDGTDARLRLKRLPAQLTVKWKFSVSGYDLEEVRLCQIPKDFYYFPESEPSDWTTNSYPTLVKEYIDYFRLKGSDLTTSGGKVTTDAEGYSNYTTWLPANVKGSAPQATAPEYRNKDIAPTGAGYLEFVAIKKANNKIVERIFYRVYLGGKETTDFNIRENTNYVWKVNINGADYNRDPRIERQETTPASENNNNFKNTSNCFMIQPNSSFSFNPYKHEAGTNEWNDQLVDPDAGTIKSDQQITSIKLMWQSKDSGTTGSLVMGYQLDDSDYTNQMELTNGTDPENARIYVRVPYSKGGNALIAAYHDNTIIWSWHLWITDYVPARINTEIGYSDYEAAQKRSLNGTVHKYRSEIFKTGHPYANMVMMDRDLGARKGGYPKLNNDNYTLTDGINRQGLLYQWGRKDPFFSSADGSTNEINIIYDGNGNPIKRPGAVSCTTALNGSTNNLLYSIQYPLTFILGGADSDWWDNIGSNGNTEAGGACNWNKLALSQNHAPGRKSLYDPSPEGWKVAMIGEGVYNNSGNNTAFTNTIFDGLQDGNGTFKGHNNPLVTQSLINGTQTFTYSQYFYNNQLSSTASSSNTSASKAKDGRVYFLLGSTDINAATIHNTVWFPAACERSFSSGNLAAPELSHFMLGDMNPQLGGVFQTSYSEVLIGLSRRGFGWPVRCIQDNKD